VERTHRSSSRARPTAIAATVLLLCAAGCAQRSSTSHGTSTGTSQGTGASQGSSTSQGTGASQGTGTATPAVSGPSAVAVSGTVLAAPGCPGPVRLDSPCPPRPLAGARVQAMQAAGVVATVTTGSDGRFTLRLAPGVYRLVATAAGPLRTAAAVQITVASSPVSTNLIVDSGMR
jgi:hypothetical protein